MQTGAPDAVWQGGTYNPVGMDKTIWGGKK